MVRPQHANADGRTGKGVESRGGAVRAVSTSRSSNRTGGFPASGSRTRILFHTDISRLGTRMSTVSEPFFAIACNGLRSSWVNSDGRLTPIVRPLAASSVVLELRPLRSPGITRLQHYYEPLRHPAQPGRSLAGVPLAVTRRHRGGFLCCVDFLSQTCHRHYPGGTAGSCRSVLPRQGQEAHSPAAAAFPVSVAGRLPRCVFRGLLSVHSRYGLFVRGTAKRSPFHRRLRRFCYLHRRSDCYRRKRQSCRAGFEPTENQHLFTAHTLMKH